MTPAKRREAGTRLCRQLTEKVTGITPTGIGHWDRAWDIVADANTTFMLALTRWEATGEKREEPALRVAYNAVLEAWRQAVVEYHRLGTVRSKDQTTATGGIDASIEEPPAVGEEGANQ